MENTLDSISPCNTNPQDEMSYLFGRDPSILAYGQKPCVSEETNKNLFSVYETEESDNIEESSSLNSVSQNIQSVKVYLRMKPFPKKLNVSQEQQEAYQIINSTTLLTRLPTLDNNTSCLKRSNSSDVLCKKFTFTKTFGPETTQLELFEQAVKQRMMDFLAGQNSTIMTYGTTNSGKSYTLQGTTTSPGIIPTCLEFVFSNITPKSTPSYKPMNHCDAVALNPLECAQELEIKTKLLTFASVDKYRYINAYKEMQKVLQKESPIRFNQCTDAHYSVWVSFAEIYNEIVYDLLSNECQKRRTPLRLATDSQGRTFIKGLKTVCVNSGSEAYQVLMAGQYNLKIAATALNARSSRSHCIFTIKLLKYYIENEPNSVEVSTFVFGDLAGSERLKKTLNIGDRLKEAQNINTSLLVLGRCLKTIHEGQLSKEKIKNVGPFRESKLTRLFQKALSGKEHIALIVNINPIPILYIETQNVLNFSAIATKIVIEKEKVRKKIKPRLSYTVTQSIKTITDWDAAELENLEWQSTLDNNDTHYIPAENYDKLISENEKLKKEIAALKSSALARDLQIRQEMADTYTNMMKDLETEWKNHIKDVEKQQEDVLQCSVKQVEDFYKQKLDQLNTRKRRRSSLLENTFDQDLKNIEELEIENSRLTSKVVVLTNNIKELEETNQILTVEKNKVCFELGLVKEDLKNVKNLLTAAQDDVCPDEETSKYVEEIKSQLFAKQEQVKKLKVFLNEAKEEYIAITTEAREKEYVIKEQEGELFEKQETIDNLEADLAHTLMWLTQKTEAADLLEEKLENQTKKIIDHENKIQDMEEQINVLKDEKLSLLEEFKLKETVVRQSVIPDIITEGPLENNKGVQTEYDEFDIDVKEKVIAIKAENAALKEKLVQSTTEMKEELESAKVKLIDTSKQIQNLQISNMLVTVGNDIDHDEKVKAIETVEMGCQVEIKFEEQYKGIPKIDLLNRSSQTIDSSIKEEANQTSFVEETDLHEVILDELATKMVKYNDIEEQYREKCLVLKQMNEEILALKKTVEKLCAENNANKIVIEDYKQSIEILEKTLSLMKEDKNQIQETLQNANNTNISVESKISEYEKKLTKTEEQLLLTKSNYNQCTEKLNTLQAEFANHISKCKSEHEEKISNLQREFLLEVEKNNVKSQCLNVHAAKIIELEHNLGTLAKLQEKIAELNKHLETCQAEKEHLQKLLDESSNRLLEFKNRLEHAEKIEQEKDAEIISLQKEMKQMINTTENDYKSDKLMEMELKNSIKDLTAANEMISRKEEYIEQLQMRVKRTEQNAKMLEQGAQERKEENKRLKSINEELKNGLIEKEREMEAFMKNRDEMVTKYECLVTTQQEELEKQKRALTKSHSKERDYCENTSESEMVVLKERRIRRPPKRFTPTSPKQNEVSVIELSGSESKPSGKRTNLPPPEQVSEKKRTTCKKKLYTGDDFCHDIEPLEATISTTPSTKTRNLRSRRK